jgi:glutaredoxin
MSTARHWFAATALLLVAGPSLALYKVVGPDGKVTYTDRAPESGGKAAPVASGAAASDPTLPLELRQAVSRYPVTFLTGPKCAPCDEGRNWLRARGIPFAERTAESEEDLQELAQRVGARELPAIVIGTETHRGFSADHWSGLFDAAGYPAASQLPRNFRYAAAEPLAPRKSAEPAAEAPPARELPPPPANPSAIRF